MRMFTPFVFLLLTLVLFPAMAQVGLTWDEWNALFKPFSKALKHAEEEFTRYRESKFQYMRTLDGTRKHLAGRHMVNLIAIKHQISQVKERVWKNYDEYDYGIANARDIRELKEKLNIDLAKIQRIDSFMKNGPIQTLYVNQLERR